MKLGGLGCYSLFYFLSVSRCTTSSNVFSNLELLFDLCIEFFWRCCCGLRYVAIKDRVELDLSYAARPGGPRDERLLSLGLTWQSGRISP